MTNNKRLQRRARAPLPWVDATIHIGKGFARRGRRADEAVEMDDIIVEETDTRSR